MIILKIQKKINSWISDKTFKLINNAIDDVSEKNFILANALAIDMEWVKKIQSENDDYLVEYQHENYSKHVRPLVGGGYTPLEFEGYSKKSHSAEIAAVANKYDILNVLGEENIRETVTNEYKKWLDDECSSTCGDEVDVDTFVKTELDKYIKELNEGYQDISSSTDFYFYVDDNVRVFAKDLKKYNGTTLQYIGIMPEKEELNKYIKNIDASKIKNLINNLKGIELDSFKDGVITEIYGYIPMFKFDYQLNLIPDLKKLGINNVFDSAKSDLSNISSNKSFIDSVTHKSTIEFSNIGIKAAAATLVGDAGDARGGFDYLFDVPVEKIDLTFNKPYMFLIRDKNSGEVWFSGSVYEPLEYTESMHG